jgi:hypothetical protein
MSERVEYEGEVVLRCQEGGFAHPAIECGDMPGGVPQDVRGKLDAFLGGSSAMTLDQLLVDAFGPGERVDGDDRLGRMRIVVERLTERQGDVNGLSAPTVNVLHAAADAIRLKAYTPAMNMVAGAVAEFLHSSDFHDETGRELTFDPKSVGYGVMLGWLAADRRGAK